VTGTLGPKTVTATPPNPIVVFFFRANQSIRRSDGPSRTIIETRMADVLRTGSKVQSRHERDTRTGTFTRSLSSRPVKNPSQA